MGRFGKKKVFERKVSELLVVGQRFMGLPVVGTGQDGDGVVRVNDCVVFVPFAKEGERVNVVVTEVFPRFAKGKTFFGE